MRRVCSLQAAVERLRSSLFIEIGNHNISAFDSNTSRSMNDKTDKSGKLRLMYGEFPID